MMMGGGGGFNPQQFQTAMNPQMYGTNMMGDAAGSYGANN
jgi:hypothetical protein